MGNVLIFDILILYGCTDRGPPVEYWWPADSKNNTLVHSKNIEFYSRIKQTNKNMFGKQ